MQPESLELPNNYFPSVEAFVIKCDKCSKWRIIPSQKKYEEIRAHIIELRFFCESALEWRPAISCDDPPDITEDGSRLWVNDIPNIPLTPPRWQRRLKFRRESVRLADVLYRYYVSPSSEEKNFRSKKEVKCFLYKNPECVPEGVDESHFSFSIPTHVPGNSTRKRDAIDNGIILSLTSSETPTKKNCKKVKRKKRVQTSHKYKKGRGKKQVSLKPSQKFSCGMPQRPSAPCPNVDTSRPSYSDSSKSSSLERMLPIKKRYRQQF